VTLPPAESCNRMGPTSSICPNSRYQFWLQRFHVAIEKERATRLNPDGLCVINGTLDQYPPHGPERPICAGHRFNCIILGQALLRLQPSAIDGPCQNAPCSVSRCRLKADCFSVLAFVNDKTSHWVLASKLETWRNEAERRCGILYGRGEVQLSCV
jgi:hypothetical protein